MGSSNNNNKCTLTCMDRDKRLFINSYCLTIFITLVFSSKFKIIFLAKIYFEKHQIPPFFGGAYAPVPLHQIHEFRRLMCISLFKKRSMSPYRSHYKLTAFVIVVAMNIDIIKQFLN